MELTTMVAALARIRTFSVQSAPHLHLLTTICYIWTSSHSRTNPTNHLEEVVEGVVEEVVEVVVRAEAKIERVHIQLK